MSLPIFIPDYLKRLAEKAESRVKEVARQYPNLPIIVSFSGGKDSSAALAITVHALGPSRVAAYFLHIPGQTISDNVMAARGVARALGLTWQTIVWMPGSPLPSKTGVVYHVVPRTAAYPRLLAARGAPAPPPRPRWCCKYYKEEPLGFAPCKNVIVDRRQACARIVIVGVKRSDSKARARRWADAYTKTFRRRGSVDIAVAPLLDFNDNDVWALLRHYNVYDIVRPQYEKWGRSPNCVLCPLSSKRQLKSAASQLPTRFLMTYYKALENHTGKIAERMKRILEEELRRRSDNDIVGVHNNRAY